MNRLSVTTMFAAIAVPAGIAAASPQQVQVTVENLATANGVSISPFFVAAHDGTFDAFNAGSAASMATQHIAELADVGPQITAFNGANPTGVSGTLVATTNAFGPGIFLPGGSGSLVLNVDSSVNRFFSFGAMVVPSNDFFVGNDSPTGIELFDSSGNFVAQTLTLTGSQIWDAGSEVNQPFGAAFLAGQDINDHVAQNSVITLGADFSPYSNLQTAAGPNLTDLPGASTPIARISFAVVPEPATLGVLGAGVFGLLLRRRSR